jgi:hypothetical protein
MGFAKDPAEKYYRQNTLGDICRRQYEEAKEKQIENLETKVKQLERELKDIKNETTSAKNTDR